MEQAEGVRLHHVGKSEDAAQLFGDGGDSDGQQFVAGFGGGDQMAYRTNPADARHQRRHFGVGTALAELFEATELSNVKTRVLNLPVFVQVQSDLGMALDAGHRVNDDGSALHSAS